MKNIFIKTGYSISSEKQNPYEHKIELLTINNADGSPRWIWNANCHKPLFLKFYNAGSKRAWFFAALIKLIFILKLQKMIFKKSIYFYSSVNLPIFDITDNWALFTGTVGPNNKAVLYSSNSFYKIATTQNAENLIQQEHTILQSIEINPKSFIIPNSKLIAHNILQLSDVSENGTRMTTINKKHFEVLNEMKEIENSIVKVGQWDLFQNLKKEFQAIDNKRIPVNMMRKINSIINAMPEEQKVELTLSHGDFTPWNMVENQTSIGLYDFELASTQRPKGFDYFHFIIQNGVLVERKSWKNILKSIDESKDNPLFENNLAETYEYLRWYLLINCMHYLKVYAEQKEWHEQIEWLLQVWNEALNTFTKFEYTSRELVIMDVFDNIQNTEYAALKFRNGYPEKMSLHSDIDIVINKTENGNLIKMLQNHSLVAKVTYTKKSFMSTIQAVTYEGEILSIDLIWQLKRKNLELLDARQIIAANHTNDYGVKCASNMDTARFVALFYVLNNSKIPKQYLVYEEVIRNSKEAMDVIVDEYFTDKKKSKKILLNYISNKKANKGLNYVKNTVNYLFDTLKKYTKNTGFIITFSGVDGAGKSTVIENIAIAIEKQFRRPVVILRHRPSILPILSVWTKGKEKAHQDAVSNLPRQGKNKNFFSSLFRFTYYYCDYLFGQFVIYFKYILPGKVVIYDRYYFDFINDSKRSNIVLPKFISTLGYYLLLKPKFNFFLFADANVILNRKKELTKAAIEELTAEYSTLFSNLKKKNNSTVYESINNIELDTTLNRIVKTITQA